MELTLGNQQRTNRPPTARITQKTMRPPLVRYRQQETAQDLWLAYNPTKSPVI
jgi:hypothetical protein